MAHVLLHSAHDLNDNLGKTFPEYALESNYLPPPPLPHPLDPLVILLIFIVGHNLATA